MPRGDPLELHMVMLELRMVILDVPEDPVGAFEGFFGSHRSPLDAQGSQFRPLGHLFGSLGGGGGTLIT